MILSDHEIEDLIRHQDMVQNYDSDLLNPASLDVRLGNSLLLESVERSSMIPLDISRYTPEHPYELVPGQFVLADTIEIFSLPEDIAAFFHLKSSRAREGYENLLAGFCDPGWTNSTLTLEIKNARQIQKLPLWPGMKIGQMIFHRMSTRPARSYATVGHYNNDLRPTFSKQFGC